MAEPYRSLYSVIPASVRDDKTLRPNAKLLYGELSALTMAEGYCWASNQYLADVFDLAPKTIEALIKQLRDRGHIYVEVERDPNTNEVLRRKIWISGPPGMVVPPPLKNKGRSPQNCGDPPLKIEGENNNNINNNIPPIVPQKGDGVPKPKTQTGRRKKTEWKEQPDWLPELFDRFWSYYPAEGRKNKQAAIRAWDNLQPDKPLLWIIRRALDLLATTDRWKDGVGIPNASTFLNQHRWTDAESVQPLNGEEQAPEQAPESGWD